MALPSNASTRLNSWLRSHCVERLIQAYGMHRAKKIVANGPCHGVVPERAKDFTRFDGDWPFPMRHIARKLRGIAHFHGFFGWL
jgi:hypothetical protein